MIAILILIVAVVILVALVLGFAMVRSGGYDPMSFALLGIFIGFALAVGFSTMIVS